MRPPSRAASAARREAAPRGVVEASLEVGLVELDDVGAGGEEVGDLLAEAVGVVAGEGLLGVVVLGDRELGQGEGAGDGHLHRPVRVGAEELHVVDVDRLAALQRPGDQRHLVGLARPPHQGRDLVPGHALHRVGDRLGVALAPNLTVGDDVDAGGLLVGEDAQHRVVPRLGEVLGGHPPEVALGDAGGEPLAEGAALEEPVGLGVAAHEGGADAGRGGHRTRGLLTPSASAPTRHASKRTHSPPMRRSWGVNFAL